MADLRSIFLKSTPDEDAYFKMIQFYANEEEDRIISNGKLAHAVYLINTLLKHARQSVKICTGRLKQDNEEIYAYADKEIAESAISFLSKEGSRLSIVVADPKGLDLKQGQTRSDDHPFVRAIVDARERIKGTLEVSQLDKDIYEQFPYHFVTIDGRALRIEVDTDKAQAYVNFNDPNYANQLGVVFSRFLENSTRLYSVPQTS